MGLCFRTLAHVSPVSSTLEAYRLNQHAELQAYDGIILEVADAGQVTSVTLF
jgi:hypothetical protein